MRHTAMHKNQALGHKLYPRGELLVGKAGLSLRPFTQSKQGNIKMSLHG